MSLIHTMSLLNNFGFQSQVDNIKLQITNINGNKNNVSFTLSFLFEDRLLKTENYDFVPDLNSSDNFIKQAYNHLKTLDEFSGAEDI